MTEATFHVPRFWLNAVAPKNVCEPTVRRIAQCPARHRCEHNSLGRRSTAQQPRATLRRPKHRSGQAPEPRPKASPIRPGPRGPAPHARTRTRRATTGHTEKRVVTLATFQAPMFESNNVAWLNICEPTARRIAQSPHGTNLSTAASGDAPPAQAPKRPSARGETNGRPTLRPGPAPYARTSTRRAAGGHTLKRVVTLATFQVPMFSLNAVAW